MDPREPLDSVAAVAGRLQAIRKLSGLNQSAFAKWTGILYTSWNSYENAVSLISVTSARKVRRKTGATYEYIYDGDVSKLPSDLGIQLDEWGLRQPMTG